MKKVNEDLVDVAGMIYSIKGTVDIKGNDYQRELVEEIANKVSELRLSVLKGIRLQKTPREELTEEVTKALLEVVRDTERPLQEVLDSAKIVYDSRIDEVREKERFHHLFRGGK